MDRPPAFRASIRLFGLYRFGETKWEDYALDALDDFQQIGNALKAHSERDSTREAQRVSDALAPILQLWYRQAADQTEAIADLCDRLDERLAAIERLLATPRETAAAELYRRGALSRARGAFDLARDDLTAATNLAPANPWIHLELARLHFWGRNRQYNCLDLPVSHRHFEKALEYFQRFSDIYGTDGEKLVRTEWGQLWVVEAGEAQRRKSAKAAENRKAALARARDLLAVPLGEAGALLRAQVMALQGEPVATIAKGLRWYARNDRHRLVLLADDPLLASTAAAVLQEPLDATTSTSVDTLLKTRDRLLGMAARDVTGHGLPTPNLQDLRAAQAALRSSVERIMVAAMGGVRSMSDASADLLSVEQTWEGTVRTVFSLAESAVRKQYSL